MAEILGLSDDAFKKAAGKSFTSFLEDWSNKAIEELRLSLESKTLQGTQRTLWNSIEAQPVKVTGKGISIAIQAAAYWDFINSGVQGVGGEMKNGSRWTNKAPSSPFSFKKDRKPSVKHFTQWSYLASRSPFAVRETVFRSGIKANHFVDEVINDSFRKEFADDLKRFISGSIKVDIITESNK